jgi:cytoskeletal protein RodZ
MNNRVRSQGGWVVNFVVVGAVLVLGLLAGLYYLKSREAARDTSSVARDTSQSDQASKDKAGSDDAAWDEGEKSKDSSTDTSTDDSESRADTQDESQTTDSSDESDSVELPQSGPSDVAAQLVGATMLTGAAVAYTQSRRSL